MTDKPYSLTIRLPMSAKAHKLTDAVLALSEVDRIAVTTTLRALDSLSGIARVTDLRSGIDAEGETQP